MLTNLFDLSQSYQEVYQLIAEQGDEDVLRDTLASINDALEDKADGYIAVVKSLEGDNAAIDEEIKRLRQRKTTNQNGIKRLKESLRDVMIETNKTRFKTALNSYSVQNNPPSLEIEEETFIPTEYWVKQDPKLDKKELLNAIKNGAEIKGVGLKQSQSLRVR